MLIKYIILKLFHRVGMSTGETLQANANCIVVHDSAGNFGDRGSAIASKHCAKYGKIAIYVGGTGSGWGRRISYICQ